MLEEEVYPHAQLARGLPYAISKAVHYAVLVLGFLLAVAALGFDMTQFTILAGAFTVGVGFGLQNIFNFRFRPGAAPISLLTCIHSSTRCVNACSSKSSPAALAAENVNMR